MAESMSRGRFVVGDYVVGKQIGSGSYSTVRHARHRIHGTEVAVKEIVTTRLTKKLQDSLVSEIHILRQINHPNIIRLHDMIQETGKIYIILEYCRGGDLSSYIHQHQGRIPEATAKHFMHQLAAGLQVLRENNVIHRDLKPQNLLLCTNDDNSILKIADFGFARSLQPRVLAETLCGSPLYMAPEIMQFQKYDAKADLWSVGVILFQLVTGKTPFTGNNQIQLLQNIVKSTELHFPPDKNLSADCIDLCRKLLRRNPVERLTFEEFFNHPFLSQRQPDELFRQDFSSCTLKKMEVNVVCRNRRSPRIIDNFPLPECNPVRDTEESSQEDSLPFSLDDDSSGHDGSSSFARRSPMRSTYGFSLDTKADRREVFDTSNETDLISKFSGVAHEGENTSFRFGSHRPSEGNFKESLKSMDYGPVNIHSKVVDSLELTDQDYVLVSCPRVDVSASTSASELSHLPSKSGSPPEAFGNFNNTSSAPVPIIGAAKSQIGCIGSLESQSSAPGISPGSIDTGDGLEQLSTDCLRRIKSLQQYASAITELGTEKIEAESLLEAFSIQLVILAIWKQALHICHTLASSAFEGSPTQEVARLREVTDKEHGSPDIQQGLDAATRRPQDICSQIVKAFLLDVGKAEELVKVIQPGNSNMPDALETIFQAALALGRRGAVDECMGNTEKAAVFYSKAVKLLSFLLVEAPSLILNPPFSLTNSDRQRLRIYVNALNYRQNISRSQSMALLKCENHQCPP